MPENFRMCVACREMKPKAELLRVAKNKDGSVRIDITGKLEGRGAYICKDSGCIQKAEKTRGFERAFKCTMPQDLNNKMKELI